MCRLGTNRDETTRAQTLIANRQKVPPVGSVYEVGLKGAIVSVEARRSKHWTERSEGSAQRGARAETLGAFWLYGTEPLALSTLFEHC